MYARAVEAGATAVTPVADQFHGDRVGSLRDPFGHRWIVATHLEDVPYEEQHGRAMDWSALALRLGFADQAHFVHAFTELVGQPPASYEDR